MNVLIEFLVQEPVENVITCMNFEIDRVIFFSHEKTLQEYGKRTERFLNSHCHVRDIRFRTVPEDDLGMILDTMRGEIRSEADQGNKVFFDITGGESLVLVAFGMLAKEFKAPIHMFDVKNSRLIEYDEGAADCISRDVARRETGVTLDLLIEMHGGKINRFLQKEVKSIRSREFFDDIRKIYQVASKYSVYWNPFSAILRTLLAPAEGSLSVSRRAAEIVAVLRGSESRLYTPAKFNEILDALGNAGILADVVHADGRYQLRYKNQAVRECLFDGGSILELYTFLQEAEQSDECLVGVHIDWDGIIHHQMGEDVLNEIDVLSRSGYVMTFISCKSGKMGPQQTLHALYELETVASRFGGKYAGKVLATASDLGKIYRERAEEMGIGVRREEGRAE